MTDRSDLVAAIHAAKDGRSLSQAVAALDAHDRTAAQRAAADRELDLGAHVAARRLEPVPAHELHTAATDWLADFEVPEQGDFRTAMIAEASTWYSRLDPAVREDGQELGEQARGRARTLASAYGQHRRQAEQQFLQMVGYLHQGASGLPQIDQTIDPNNAPAPTPYPTEVFPTFGEEQDPFNGVETNNHQSGASSEGAPMLQQLNQQQSSGSGFGSGPEKPDEHDTSFDTSNSYAEVPLGAPGTLPTQPAATDSMGSSHPNPVAGTQQDAGADRRQVAAVQGYSMPDAFGYRWVTTAEVHHPYHTACSGAHWPDEPCGGSREHTASVAVGYSMDLHKAARLDAAERLGAQEGLHAYHASQTVADLVAAHNRFAAAWGDSDRTDEDSAVLHGYMAVVRPVMADLLHEARDFSEAEREKDAKSGDALPDGKLPIEDEHDLENAERLKGKVKGVPKSEVNSYMREKEKEFGHKESSRSRLDFPRAAEAAFAKGAPFAGYKDFAACVAANQDKGDPEAYCGKIKHRVEGASSLTQVQQIVDPNNTPTPGDDDLPDGVAFPLNPDWEAQWQTGPQGAAPKGATPSAEAAGMGGMTERAAGMFGRMDALEGKNPHHKDNYPFSPRIHGAYLRGWNTIHGASAGLGITDPINREAYSGLTGRPDLHAHWRDAFDTARRYYSTNQGSRDTTVRGGDGSEQIEQMASRKQADAWSQPRQSTDDLRPPYSAPETNVPMVQPAGDYEAGAAAGKADRAAGERPAFADNSSGVSQYVKGYAEAYSAAPQPQGAQDVPYSMGGDSGQAMNAQDAERAYRADPLSGVSAGTGPVSAAFAPRELMQRPEFRKGYLFARQWLPGDRLVSTGSAEFEAGLYAGITDRPADQAAWAAAHGDLARKGHPELAERIAKHASFTAKTAGKHGLQSTGFYLVRKAGTTTDLITDGPGTSPDPMGATPLTGPGTPPPMAGRDEAAAPGGAPPYQGAPPLPGGPVVPDDVMGDPQQAPQPSGPFTNTFSGDHPENASLAPVAPNSADQPGYTNKDAYQGDPHGGDKLAAFRARVQAGLQRMGAPIHDEVEHHLRNGLAEFHARKRAHPHMDLQEISARTHGKVGPRELESVLADLVNAGRAHNGPAYGEWEATE